MGGALAAACLKHPAWVALVVAGLSAAFAAGLPRLKVETSFNSILEADHPFIATTNDVVGTFGSHLPLIVTLDAGRPVTAADVKAVTPFFESLESLPHADRVAHPGNTPVLRGGGEGLDIVPMLEASDGQALAYPLVGRRRESLAAVVYVSYRPGRDDRDAFELFEEFRRRIEAEGSPEGWRLRVAGLVSIYWEARSRIIHDIGMFMGLSLLLMTALLVVMYRRLSAVVAPMGVVLLTQVWSFGLMGWVGLPLNLAATLLPAVIVVVGVADALHFLNQVAQARSRAPHAPSKQWVLGAARQVALPCLLTTVTTMAGFLSLATSELLPIRGFGLMAGLAIGIALALTFTALPVLMALFPPLPSRRRPSRLDPVPGALAQTRRLLRHPRALLALWTVAIVTAAFGISQVKVDTGFDALFPASDPVAVDQRWIEDRYFGADVLGIRWRAEDEGQRIDDPAVLRSLLELSEHLADGDDVKAVLGLPNIIDELRRGLTQGEPPPPWSRPLAAQLELLFEQADAHLMRRFATADRSQGVLIVQVDTGSAESMQDLVERTRRWLADHDPPGHVDLFGPVFMFQALIFTVVESLARSFGLALLMVWIFVSIGVRSPWLGLLGMAPNLVPIVAVGGVMGLLGITLNDQTVMVASIGIGIAVDDTVHLLVAWRRRFQAGLDAQAAVFAAIDEVGPALVATSVVLVAGFGLGVLSSFAPPRTFSGLACLLVVMALLADLLLLTVLLGRRSGAR